MPDAAGAVPQPALPVQPKSAKSERRRSVAPQETAQIVDLFRQGISIKDIGAQLNIHGQVVNGLIQSARRRGLLPSAGMRFSEIQKALLPPLPEQIPPGAVPVSPMPVEQVSPPMNGNYQQPASASPTPMVDDFSGGRPVVGASGGFTGSTQTVRYTVERITPPDGLLGTHYGSFSVEELGQNYGEGHYKVTKHDPANPKFAFEYFQKIGKSYGAARSPNHAGSHSATPNRPFFQRNWGTQNPEEEQPERPVYRPYQRPDSDRMLSEFARQSHHANSAGLDKAIEVMGTMHQQSIAQIEAARKTGPDSMITSFFREQQELANHRLEEERTREERRRKDEEDKWQRRQEEEQRRWERDQTAERDRHQRELERIARETEAREKALRLDAEEREKRATEERRFLLDLEEKKINLVRQEGESAQKRLEAELTKSREEMKEMSERTNKTLTENQEATTRHIEESQKQIQEQLDREREQLEREHKLKEKALDVRREYDTKMYELQKENMVNSGGDQIFNTINTVIKEVSKGLEKVVDLKKLETLSPEAQAAAVARGTIQGPNVGESYPHRQQAGAPPQAPIQEPQPAAQAEGQTAPAPEQPAPPHASPGEAVVENRMESLINENLKKPFFQEVLKEWALHVQSGTDPSIFANFYLEMMRDERNGEGRQACAAFATFMQPRNWKLMYKVLEKACDEETKTVFQSENAAGFYESFRAMVTEQIRDYWEQFVQSRIQKNAAAGAAPNGIPLPQAPVEPAGTQAKSAAPSGQSP